MIIEKCAKFCMAMKQGRFAKAVSKAPLTFLRSTLELPPAAVDTAKTAKIELKSYTFPSQTEQLRKPRIVRVGIFQNSIPVATWTPLQDARNAFYNMAKEAIAIAANAKVNIFCFQEAWGEF